MLKRNGKQGGIIKVDCSDEQNRKKREGYEARAKKEENSV